MTPEEQQMLLDLGIHRREEIARNDGPGQKAKHITATHTIQVKQARSVNTKANTRPAELGGWCNLVDDSAPSTEHDGPDAGQLYRLRSGNVSYGAETGRDDERTEYLRSKTNSHIAVSRYARNHITSNHLPPFGPRSNILARPRTMPSSYTMPGTPRRRAQSPRAAGVTRFLHGQRIETVQGKRIKPAAAHKPQASKQSLPRSIPVALPVASPVGKDIEDTTAAFAKLSISSVLLPQQSKQQTQQKTAPHHTNEVISATSTPTDHFIPAAFKQYVAHDMTIDQLQEILTVIFDPARALWLDKHMPLLEAFDRIGQAFRAGIMQICELDNAKVAEFLHDYKFVPQLPKHVDAAKSIIETVRAGGQADTKQASETQYQPFWKIAERVLKYEKEHTHNNESVSAPSLFKGSASPARQVHDLGVLRSDSGGYEGLALVQLLTKNARAMLSQRSKMPAGIKLSSNGTYHRV